MKTRNAIYALALVCCISAAALATEPPLHVQAVDTSRVMGSPNPLPSMEVERAFPSLRIPSPVQPTHAGDGTNRVFVVTQAGMIHVFPNDAGASSATVFLDIRDRVTNPGGDNGMFCIAFHPQYRNNGEFYVVYGTRARPKATRVSRFKVSANDPNRADPNSEEVLIQIVQPWPDHNAACLAFGPDGYLYISLGDGGYNLKNRNAQDKSTLLGAMLRIDVDQRDNERGYGVPPDNPFISDSAARDEIWAYGLRAPWRFSFDRLTGDCWLGDNGQVEFEEVNLIQRGANYGWMPREGFHAFDPSSADPRGRPAQKKPRKREPETNRNDGFTDPIIEYDHSQGRSVVGGVVYRGANLPELIGAYIYGDYGNGNIWALRWDGKRVVENKLIARSRIKISSFGEDEHGELWFTAMDGFIYRLRRANRSRPQNEFPELLSKTGLFESTGDHQLASGVIPYSVNVPLWSDGAGKDRFVALPRLQSVDFDESDAWSFPVGTVFIKTFSLELEKGNPDSAHRLETRLLVRNPRGWAGYTYRWLADQSDARLLGGAATTTLNVVDDGATRQQRWYFPSPADCMVCHTRAAGFALGATTRQLNRKHAYEDDDANQITTLALSNVFRRNPRESSDLPAWRDWSSPQAESLSERARAYLDVNCSTCHTPPGYTKLDLRWTTPLEQTHTINLVPEKPRVGPPNSKIIAPGQPNRSELYLRMIHSGNGRMPNIASSQIDDEGVKAIRAWIEMLGREFESKPK